MGECFVYITYFLVAQESQMKALCCSCIEWTYTCLHQAWVVCISSRCLSPAVTLLGRGGPPPKHLLLETSLGIILCRQY